jgi:hypothetical protein
LSDYCAAQVIANIAVEILSTRRKIGIPGVVLGFYSEKALEIISTAKEIPIDQVINRGNMMDDDPVIELISSTKTLYLRLSVTKLATYKDRAQMAKLGVSAIEVDLRDVRDSLLKREIAKRLSTLDRISWVRNHLIASWRLRYNNESTIILTKSRLKYRTVDGIKLNTVQEIARSGMYIEGENERVVGCPINMDRILGVKELNKGICKCCPYCIELRSSSADYAIRDDYIKCLGKKRIDHLEDFKKPHGTRVVDPKTIKAEYLGALQRQRAKLELAYSK